MGSEDRSGGAVSAASPSLRRVKLPPAPLPPAGTEEEIAVDAARAETVDRFIHAFQGRFTSSLSPSALWLAYLDWATHLANAPGKRGLLVEKALRKWLRFVLYAMSMGGKDCAECCIDPLPQDRRFNAPEWRQPPFNLIYQSFL